MLSKFRAEKIALSYFLFAMLWILTSDYLLGLLVSDPVLLVSISTYKGILFVCTTALLLYLVLRVWFFSPHLNKEAAGQHESRKGLVMVFAGMALLVPLISLSVIQIAKPQAISSAQTHIQMVAEMKADYLNQWFSERAHLMDMIGMDYALHDWVADWNQEISAKMAVNQLTGYINRLHASYQYDGVYLYHIEKQQALAAGVIRYQTEELDNLIAQAISTGDSFFSGLHESDSGLSLSWVLPLYASGQYATPSAVMILSLDPEIHLYPNLSQWPDDSYSAELFLLQSLEQKRYLLLSPVKSDHFSILSSLEYHGTDGVGYKNDDVIGVLKPLTQVNWIVAAQQERGEVLSPIYMMAAWLGLLSMATVISVMFALRLVWLQQRRLEQAAYQMKTAEKDQLLLKFFEMPFVGMAITDPITGKWLQFNPEMCRLLGYSESELKELTWHEVTHPDDLQIDKQAFQRLVDAEVDSYTLEKQFIRKNGIIFNALLSVGSVRYPNGKLQYAIATVQDITDQKR
ncbi:MAG: PAS domain S-box protein, partial [Oceanospirillales bacterium]